MAEKVCPLSFACSTGNTICRTDCRLWDGDCGLKVTTVDYAKIVNDVFERIVNYYLAKAQGDKYKKMWEAFRTLIDDDPRSMVMNEELLIDMDKIEAEVKDA